MKLAMAFLATFALLMLALHFYDGGESARVAFAGSSFTSSPSETVLPSPNECGDTPDEGDDDGDREEDDEGRDDGGEQAGGTDTSVQGEDGWEGFDPDTESDDCWGPRYPVTCNGQPIEAPGIYYFAEPNFAGLCRYYSSNNPFIGDFNDLPRSFKLVGHVNVELCHDAFYEGGCVVFADDERDLSDDGMYLGPGHGGNVSSHRFDVAECLDVQQCGTGGNDDNANPEPVNTNTADANCDGGVDGTDALAVLSFASGAGNGCTGSGRHGDADCSGNVDTTDATQILLVATGFETAAC